jgi:hypothetical protein
MADDKLSAALRQLREQSRPPSPGVLQWASDHPSGDTLPEGDDEEQTLALRAALPARFHVPTWYDLATPHSWICEVCWAEGITSAWPCATARKLGSGVLAARDDSPVHRLLAVVDAALKLAAEWKQEAERLDEKAERALDGRSSALLSIRAQGCDDHSRALLEAITSGLPGELTDAH